MKKLVLIMVSALVLTIFISFNYLLWFRGQQVDDFKDDVNNLKTQLAQKDVNANSNTSDYLKQLTEKEKMIDSLTSEISQLKENNNKLEQDKQQEIINNRVKSAIIDKLKQQADLEPLKSIIKKWVDYIDKGDYENAYKLQNNVPMTQNAAKNLSEFTDSYKNSIKSIKLKSIDLFADNIHGDKKGSIIFKAVLDVTKLENTNSKEFVQGLNNRYFTLTVDDNINAWVISDLNADIN